MSFWNSLGGQNNSLPNVSVGGNKLGMNDVREIVGLYKQMKSEGTPPEQVLQNAIQQKGFSEQEITQATDKAKELWNIIQGFIK